MKRIGFYHSADLDGRCSGAIIYRYFGKDIEMIGIDYGYDFPWHKINKDTEVWMADFGMQPFSDMIRLSQTCKRLIWIDHHDTAIKDYEESGLILGGTRTISKAACEITWRYCYPEKRMPRTVHFLGRYDIWKHQEHEGCLEFQHGIRLRDNRVESDLWDKLLIEPDESPSYIGHLQQLNPQQYAQEIEDAIIRDGTSIVKYKEQDDKGYAKACHFLTEIDGVRVVAINRLHSNSLLFDSVWEKSVSAGAKAMLLFGWKKGSWRISMYSKGSNAVHVGEICKRHGGGGHEGAAGFQCQELPFRLGRPKITVAQTVPESTLELPYVEGCISVNHVAFQIGWEADTGKTEAEEYKVLAGLQEHFNVDKEAAEESIATAVECGAVKRTEGMDVMLQISPWKETL